MGQETCSALLLNTLLQSVEEAVTIVDEEATVRYWNKAAERLYDISGDEIIGKSILDFPWKSLMVQRVLADGVPIRNAYHEPNPNLHVLINTVPIIANGKIKGAISTERDVTQIVRLGHELMQSSNHGEEERAGITEQRDDRSWDRIVGRSTAIQETIQMAKKVAKTDANILLTGDSGVGKELFAHAIHHSSLRSEGPFIAINCGAVPAPLFESELFGYAPGSFTGADRKGREGKLALTDGGTLCLDEVGEMPLEMQVKLLRVLEEKSFYPIGASKPVRVSVRIIAATNRNLIEEVRQGRFREDLYYRLNVVNLRIPPLRERLEDIPILVQRFLREFSAKYNRVIPELNSEMMIHLMQYDWPGNVRQLRNTMERLVILAVDGEARIEHLPEEIRPDGSGVAVDDLKTRDVPVSDFSALNRYRRKKVSKDELERVLLHTYGNKSAAAKELGISRGTLYNYLKRYGL
ncbi:sigma-54 interaction domain-containing protein [Desmospora profundinema]|uniref:PAS domain S-box-containing protein n=1 Tax=Desmospora profundinema TaxID=1571184 RepID=A0ABU1IHV1_9BACL|nr:sigma 54-interacting transcriptional regulator [Desmospora profundinema]MDR6224348.1 PAS domain S-box-containing protein [Desmospora profundinema]